MFFVGQRIVCVNDKPSQDGLLVPLRLSHTYVIADICGDYTYRDPAYKSVLGFSLVGVPNMPSRYISIRGDRIWLDGRYGSIRFRPAVEKKTDITVFTALLNPTNHHQFEDA